MFPPILHVRDWISDSKIVIFILTPLYSIAVDAIAIYLTLGILNKLYGRRNTQIFKQYFNDFLKTLVIYRSLTFVDLTAELYVKGCARAGMDGKTTYDFASFFRHKTMLTGAFRVSIDRGFPGANGLMASCTENCFAILVSISVLPEAIADHNDPSP